MNLTLGVAIHPVDPFTTYDALFNIVNLPRKFNVTMIVFVVIPTYNEAHNLPKITAAIFAQNIPNLQILVVDDDSPDGTGQVADALVDTYPGRFHVIHRRGKLGLGTAYITGFRWALGQGAERIIQMDADFSHSPDYIPQMLEYIEEYDVVVGSRYVPGGQLDKDWGWWRQFLSWWANAIWTRPVLGVRTKDATAGFKCWRRAALERIGLERIKSNGYVFQVEMTYVSEKIGLQILEFPIYFEDRRIGQSKMTVRVKIEGAIRVFEIRMRHYNVKPMALPGAADGQG